MDRYGNVECVRRCLFASRALDTHGVILVLAVEGNIGTDRAWRCSSSRRVCEPWKTYTASSSAGHCVTGSKLESPSTTLDSLMSVNANTLAKKEHYYTVLAHSINELAQAAAKYQGLMDKIVQQHKAISSMTVYHAAQ